jgi:hypothetical protein
MTWTEGGRSHVDSSLGRATPHSSQLGHLPFLAKATKSPRIFQRPPETPTRHPTDCLRSVFCACTFPCLTVNCTEGLCRLGRKADARRGASRAQLVTWTACTITFATPVLIRETLGYLADRVGGRLRKANLPGRTVTVRVRFAHLRTVTRSVTLSVAISTTLTPTEWLKGWPTRPSMTTIENAR